MGHLVNDLEPPAFALRPDLARLRSRIERNLGQPVRMSGSGSTLFTLFDDHGSAADAAAAIIEARTGGRRGRRRHVANGLLTDRCCGRPSPTSCGSAR